MLERVYLRKISEEDTENIVKWRNNKSVKANLYAQIDLTAEQHLWWLENKVKTGLCAQYIIVIDEDGVQNDIGTVFIKNIDRESNKGEYGIQIGEETSRGKGYGTIAAKMMLDIAFNELSLNKVYLSVLSNNIPAIKSYINSGFRLEGICKQDYCRDGKYYDIVMMGITKSDWKIFK